MTISLASKPCETFAAFVRERVIQCIATPEPPCARKPMDDLTRHYFMQLNNYLSRESEHPIDVEAFADIPENLAQQLAKKLEISHLRYETTPFTHGEDVKARVNSHDRNRYLADFMRATSAYFSLATHEPPAASTQIKLWKRVVIQHANGPNTTELEEVNRIDPNKHCIIAFNGIVGMHTAGRTNGLISEVERLIQGEGTSDKETQKATTMTPVPVKGKDVQVYAVSIPDRNRIHYASEVPASNADPNGYISPMAREFTHRVILPSIGLDESSHPITLAQAKTAMRQLNMMTFSYGSILVREIRNVIAETLATKGLPDHEIKAALAQAYALHINPVCRLDDTHPCGDFSSIYEISKNDITAAARADYEQFTTPNAKLPLLIPIGDHGLMVWSDTPLSIERTNPEDQTKTYEIYSSQAAAMLPHSGGLQMDGHLLSLNTRSYAYVDQILPKIEITKFHDPAHVQLTLRNAVGASELPTDLSETFEPPKPEGANTAEPRPKLSETMKLAIERFRQGIKARVAGK